MTAPILSQSFLKELITYHPDSGVMVWNWRPIYHFKTENMANFWNRLHAGRPCGGKQSGGYLHITIGNNKYLSHRLIFLYMEGLLPEEEVDHINHNRADNRWINLRKISKKENAKNKRPSSRNLSGICGVHYIKATSNWIAVIGINRKYIHLGTFSSKEEAISARHAAEVKYGFHKNHGT